MKRGARYKVKGRKRTKVKGKRRKKEHKTNVSRRERIRLRLFAGLRRDTETAERIEEKREKPFNWLN